MESEIKSYDTDFISVSEFKSENFQCTICFEEYDLTKRKPLILECGHTICNLCVKDILKCAKKCCPFCNKSLIKRNVSSFSQNFAYMELINEFTKKTTKKTPSNYVEIVSEIGIYNGQTIKKIINSKNTELKHGIGKMKYNDGLQYDGEWFEDKKHGKGACIYSDGSKYTGDWVNDSPQGEGIFEFFTGEFKSYSGGWRKGKFFGLGTLTYRDNNSKRETVFIDGHSTCDIMKYVSNEYTLFGKFDDKIRPSGIIYKIDNMGNTFHGLLDENNEYYQGVLYCMNGEKVEGNFKEGLLCGEGRYLDFKGDLFEGNFMKGRLHGYGKMTLSNRDVFEGTFENGIMEGKGEIWYSNGDHYSGQVTKNLPHGTGIMYLIHGDIYEGEFFKGMFSGKGKYKSVNGCIYEGDFFRNMREGQGYEVFPNKETYCGQFSKGKRHGSGILVLDNAETYKGEFYEGVVHGNGTLVKNDGSEYKGKFEKGVLVKTPGKSKDCLIF
jgi:hypothetical protein